MSVYPIKFIFLYILIDKIIFTPSNIKILKISKKKKISIFPFLLYQILSFLLISFLGKGKNIVTI